MIKTIYFLTVLLSLSLSLHAQEEIPLWNTEKAPTESGLENNEAMLYVFQPKENKKNSNPHPAVLICPGGGYASVSMTYEGRAFAEWMAKQGFVAIVLKYRLPNKHKEIPFDDAEKAMEIIHANATKWNIDTNKIGIAGFSAGGHLAAIYSNTESTYRPNFTLLFYPVISFENVTKGGTRPNLIGSNPSQADITRYSAELQVTEQTPPAIIFMSDDDPSVPSNHAILYYNALKSNNVSASLHIFPEGGHGWSMLDSFRYNNDCLMLLESWLEKTGIK